MKVVAVALVLIAGAAVVLWYGNTANSWVVGGLVGGLAALLLSIPISLSLFSYLSRRHDERVRAEGALIEEEISLSQVDDDPRFARRSGRHSQQYIESSIYELEDAFEMEDALYAEERARRHQPGAQKRLPASGPSSDSRRGATTNHSPSFSREVPKLPAPKARTKELNEQQTKDLDRTLPRRGNHPGLPGSDTATFRSKYQSEALHTARLEAARQIDDEHRPTQHLKKNPAGGAKSTYRKQKPAGQVEQSGRQSENRSTLDDFAAGEERAFRQGRRRETETGSISRHSVETEPIMSPDEQPHQGTRHPHIAQEYLNAEDDTNTVHRTRPLIRRAPYLYEDDPLRQELYQHIEAPQVRRSSRKEAAHHDEEEE
ncbi:MAG TPA: hypothetical protein VL485_33005 [Ktedonobacteraceae bacterium]|jgi:hypothetical protein|nr:hypothetical protein [Ktedonobacteraceae bacterium]